MAHVSLYVIAASVAIFASLSDACTNRKVQRCIDNHRNNNDCPFYDRMIYCIGEFYDECEGAAKEFADSSLEDFKDQIAYHKSLCPGLPKGTCYFNVIQECVKDVPFEATSQDCTAFNSEPVIACLKRIITTSCSTKKGGEKINRAVEDVKKWQAKCDAL